MSIVDAISLRRRLSPARLLRAPGWAYLLVPTVLFLGVFFAMPIVDVAIKSLTEPGPSNYTKLTDSPLYADVLWNTFKVSLLVTALCVMLGYPYAYLMHHVGPRLATVLAVLVLLPFWTSLLVRTYSWLILLQDTGAINSLLTDLGLISSPLGLIRNLFSVSIGMTHILLPFMVLPLYAAMRRVDPAYIAAAESLGASRWRSFRVVFLPLTYSGVIAGSLLVFILSLGFYITPALLGGPGDTMIGELIVIKYSQQLDFGVGAALGIVLLLCTLIVLFAASRVIKLQSVFGGGDDA